jgi:hypothetical protein
MGKLFICTRRTRVARWYICKPKIPIWVNFGFAMKDVGKFNGHLVNLLPFSIHFMGYIF